MDSEERRALIQMALGKASMAFMTQPTGGEIVMPTEELLEVAEDIHAIWALEVDALAAEVRELRKDRERLDFVLEHYCIEIPNVTHGDFPRWLECREEIDAALSSRGEDAGA